MRAILLASLAKGTSSITNLLPSPDVHAMLTACNNMGAKLQSSSSNDYQIRGCDAKPVFGNSKIDVANSGQVMRFMTAIASLQTQPINIYGDASANTRPMRPLLHALSLLGATCFSNNGTAPVSINGPINNYQTKVFGADSQHVSALLMMLPLLEQPTELIVEQPGELPWIDLTCYWLTKVGISFYRQDYEYFSFPGKQHFTAFDYKVVADYSSLAFPLVAALLTQSTIEINNIDPEDIQGDKVIIQILQSMGAQIVLHANRIVVKPSKLQPAIIDLNNCIDAVPIMAVLATQLVGTTKLINIAVASTKECDRLQVMQQELTKLSANIINHGDSLEISHSRLVGSTVDSYHDHRVAMALIVAGMVSANETIVRNVDCIQKSYHNFISQMQYLGCPLIVS